MIVTGSTAGLWPATGLNGGGLQGPGGAGYGLAKKMVKEYTKVPAMTLGPKSIRVDAVHPANCETDMLHNQQMYKTFRPDLEAPTRADAEVTFPFLHAMPIPDVQPSDISHAVVYLAADESRHVSGLQMFVDAGAGLKMGL